MKFEIKHLIIFILIIGAFVTFIILSGIISIRASSGHWKITNFFLHFSMERSISTYSLPVSVPYNLDEAWLVQKGASQYSVGCSFCHGDPMSKNFIGKKMTAKAPALAEKIKNWEPEELFTIIKHGVKFTGMPAWPSLARDDEVWAMVAFLQKLPKLDKREYKKLIFVSNESSIKDRKLQYCIDCHGLDGNGRGIGAFPKLAGHPYKYLKNSLDAYVSGKRHSGIMELAVISLDNEDSKKFAHYFSKQILKKHEVIIDFEARKRGEKIANQGIPEQGVATCIACHGPNQLVPNPEYPNLAGQYSEYLILQLDLFKKGKRGGTKYSNIMHEVVRNLSEEQIQDVAHYYESLFLN